MLARLVSMTVDCSSNASIYSINIGNWWCCDKYRELSKANSTELIRQRWWWPAGPIPFILQILSTICDLATEKNRLAYYYISFRITFLFWFVFFSNWAAAAATSWFTVYCSFATRLHALLFANPERNFHGTVIIFFFNSLNFVTRTANWSH